MKIDVPKTIAQIPNMSEKQLAILRNNAERLLGSVDVKTRESAQTVLEEIRAHEAAETKPPKETLSDTERVRRINTAFTRKPLTETDKLVLKVVLTNPRNTSESLSRKLGWGGQAWHAHFGAMCRDRESWLWPALDSKTRDAKFWSSILADFNRVDGTWTVKAELAPTLAKIVELRL